MAGLVLFFGAVSLVALFLSPQQAGVAGDCAVAVADRVDRDAALGADAGVHRRLRGAGDTAGRWLFTILGFVGVRLPLAYLFVSTWQLGRQGAWYAMVVDVLVRCALISFRFLHGGWKRMEV